MSLYFGFKSMCVCCGGSVFCMFSSIWDVCVVILEHIGVVSLWDVI